MAFTGSNRGKKSVGNAESEDDLDFTSKRSRVDRSWRDAMPEDDLMGSGEGTSLMDDSPRTSRSSGDMTAAVRDSAPSSLVISLAVMFILCGLLIVGQVANFLTALGVSIVCALVVFGVSLLLQVVFRSLFGRDRT